MSIANFFGINNNNQSAASKSKKRPFSSQSDNTSDSVGALGAPPLVIPHKKPAAAPAAVGGAASINFFTIEEVKKYVLKKTHGIAVADDVDDVDLDNTSCAESDEDPQPSHLPDMSSDSLVRSMPALGNESDDDDDGEPDADFEQAMAEVVDDDDVNSSSLFGSVGSPPLRESVVNYPAPAKAAPAPPAPIAKKKDRRPEKNFCFLCQYGGRGHSEASRMEILTLLRILHENIGETRIEYIALAMHRFYREIQRRAALRGEFLPRWPSKKIFICLTTHNLLPEVKTAMSIRTLSIAIQAVEQSLFFNHEGNPMPNHVALRTLRELIKARNELYALKMKDLNFHREGEAQQLGFVRDGVRGMTTKHGARRSKRQTSALAGL